MASCISFILGTKLSQEFHESKVHNENLFGYVKHNLILESHLETEKDDPKGSGYSWF